MKQIVSVILEFLWNRKPKKPVHWFRKGSGITDGIP
jgi:hypothetical protein